MQPAAAQPNALFMIAQFLIIGVIFYFLLIRPEQQKQKAHKELLGNLKKNDEVVTSGGIHGVVVMVKERTVVLRLDENCRVEFDREAIAQVTKKAE